MYRATDTALGRQVAIKILPEAFAADPERLARFEGVGLRPREGAGSGFIVLVQNWDQELKRLAPTQ